jgi:hypothetical protein
LSALLWISILLQVIILILLCVPKKAPKQIDYYMGWSGEQGTGSAHYKSIIVSKEGAIMIEPKSMRGKAYTWNELYHELGYSDFCKFG